MVPSGGKDPNFKVLDKAPSSGQQPPHPGGSPVPSPRPPTARLTAVGSVAARPGCRAGKPKIILRGRTGAAAETPRHRGGVPGGVWASNSGGLRWGARRGKIPGREVAASRGSRGSARSPTGAARTSGGAASSRGARAARSPLRVRDSELAAAARGRTPGSAPRRLQPGRGAAFSPVAQSERRARARGRAPRSGQASARGRAAGADSAGGRGRAGPGRARRRFHPRERGGARGVARPGAEAQRPPSAAAPGGEVELKV